MAHPSAPIAAPPPILEIISILSTALTASFRFLSRTTLAVLFSFLASIPLVLSPVLYILSPVLVLVHVLLDVFILTPYAVLTSLARNLYPIYVLVGVAVICALGVGLLARFMSVLILRGILAPRARPTAAVPELVPERDAPSPPERREKSALRTGAPKARARKRVSIKEERDA